MHGHLKVKFHYNLTTTIPVLYMQTDIHLLSYCAHFALERFRQKLHSKLKNKFCFQ